MSIKNLPNKRNPYQVPTDYFEKLPDILLEKAKTQPKKIILAHWGKYASSAAAVLILTFVFFFMPQNNNENILDLTHFSEQEIKTYLLHEEGLNEAEIVAYLKENQHQIETDLLDDIPTDVIEEEIYLEEIQLF